MILTNLVKALKNLRAERYARIIPSPNSKVFDGKCSVCKSWGFDTDNYCANCGAKFKKEKEK